MNIRLPRRDFLQQAAAGMALASPGLVSAAPTPTDGQRVFLAGSSHETNTFHPVATRSYSYREAVFLRLHGAA